MNKKFVSIDALKNILFDFGGVLYHISVQKAVNNFKKTGIEVRPWQSGQDEIFDLMETGKISRDEILLFFKKFSTRYPQPSDNEILHAFNSILTGLDFNALNYLRKLRRKYRLFILSNTNEIHYRKFSVEINSNPASADFYSSFIKEYYSFQTGLRKPDPGIFNFVVRDAGINPSETLFVDDSRDNTLAAEKLGFRVFHFAGKTPWEKLTSNFKLL